MIKLLKEGGILLISFFVHSIAMIGSMFASFFIFYKFIQYNADLCRKIISMAWCLLWACLYGYASTGFFLIPLTIIIPLACFASIIFVFFLTRENIEIVISAYLLSHGISYFLRFIASFIIGLIPMFLINDVNVVSGTPIDFNKPIYILLYTLTAIIQFILAFLFFRIRRFRKGFPFIFNKFTIVAALFLTGTILILVTYGNVVARGEEYIYIINSLYIAGIVIAGIGIYILIRRLIKMFQARRVQQNTDNYYENLLAEKDKEIKLLNKDIRAKQTIIHNYVERINSMEKIALKYGGELLESVQNLKKDFRDALGNIKGKNYLQSTKVRDIDILFEYFAEEFINDNIIFNVMVDGSIKYMIDNVIEQGKLLIIIANHLKNAQIAVNASGNPSRLITAIIGLPNDCYEFTVLDSGISFEIDTLSSLGKECVTTHADTGGSGIGLMTTFEIMKEYGASLIIDEKPPSEFDYTKSITVRFDGENKYIIESYRSEYIY